VPNPVAPLCPCCGKTRQSKRLSPILIVQSRISSNLLSCLFIYAWNLCPVPGTDISRFMVAVGREFSFPINISTGKHAKLYSTPGTIE
jgi:hypothetical protein